MQKLRVKLRLYLKQSIIENQSRLDNKNSKIKI